jgi:hypothetical protein
MLQSALEKEVDDFLGRGRYQRTTDQWYLNGHLPKRTIGVGVGAVDVSLPECERCTKAVSRTDSVRDRGELSAAVADSGALMVRLYVERQANVI